MGHNIQIYIYIYCLDYNNYAINRSYPTPTYDYRHHNPWEKANYATFHPQSPLFSTGSIPSINKSYHPSSFDTIPNLNNTNPNFYRRHSMFKKEKNFDIFFNKISLLSAESTLPHSTSIYSSSTSTSFNYSPHPSELFFGWNNSSSLMRTHSASYQDYPGSSMFFFYYKVFFLIRRIYFSFISSIL